MDEIYTARQIGEMIGVSGKTIILWSKASLIPQPFRQGIQRRYVWSGAKAKLILDFATGLGYLTKYTPQALDLSEGGIRKG